MAKYNRNYTQTYYVYSKLRKNFGRQPLFQVTPAHMLDSIPSNKAIQKEYILRNPVDRSIQATMPQSEHDANTKELIIHEQGTNHTEGGWPREINLDNEEHIARYRRRVLHDDNYINTVMNITPQMEHYLDQNNAIDMYQSYYSNMQTLEPVENYQIRVANVFSDSHHRPISCMAWPIEKNLIAVSYCHKVYEPQPDLLDSNTACYIWDIKRQSEPLCTIKPEEACWQLACSPADPKVIVLGLQNGVVNVFDTRVPTSPASRGSVYNSHREPITALLYTHSRTNTEFFTGSLDGQCLWWDTRNLSKPLDQLTMSVRLSPGEEPNFSNSESVSALQFDRAFPTKFLCGTDTGLVINVNRMEKSHSDMLHSYWNAHTGPVRAIHRSRCTTRMFLTCGDWSVRIWSEEVRTAPIVVTKPYRHQVLDADWSPLKFSSFMAVCSDGMFYYWNLLRKYREHIATQRVSKHELTKISPNENGQLIAVGDINGSLYLLKLSDNMILPGNNEKQLMQQLYERETRREHILDLRVKEIRLKHREDEAVVDVKPEVLNEEAIEKTTEEEYFRIVKEEFSLMGGSFTKI